MRTRPYVALVILCLSCLAMAQQPVNHSQYGGNAAAASGVNGLMPVGGYGSNNASDAAWTSATSGNTAAVLISNIATYNSILVTLVQGTTITGGVVTFEQSIDNSTWTTVQGVTLGTTVIMGPTYTLVASTNISFLFPVNAPYFRVRLSTVITGSGTVTIQHAAQTMPAVGLLAGSETLAAGSNVIGSLTANQSVNTAQVAGTTTDTNSGSKSAGTQRVVIATDQPQLTNKLLVTPDSVALPANQSVNVSQVNGTAPTEKAASTQPALADTALVTSVSPNNTGLPVNLPKIVNKASANVGGATVKTLTDTITATVAGNSLVAAVCAGEPLPNGSTVVATLTETGGSDTFTSAVSIAQSTTFHCGIYYATNITGGVTAVIMTYSGASSVNTSIAMEVWEVSGLLALSPQVFDTSATGNATSTAPSAGPVFPVSLNEYTFAAFGVGTAAQTVTLAGSGTWANDSGQVNPASASGLFSFVGASQFWSTSNPLIAAGTITSEPWVMTLATFKPVIMNAPAPGQMSCTGTALINVAAASGATIITGVSGKMTYICGIQVLSAAANNVAIIEGTSSGCSGSPLGLFGGATAATGWNFAANGGIAFGNGVGIVGKSTVTGNNVCILPSGSGQVSGSIVYAQF